MATATKTPNGNISGPASAPSALKSEAKSEDLRSEIDTLRADLASLTSTISSLGRAKGDEALSAAKAKAAEVRSKAADHAETAKLQATELQHQATDYVRTNPGTALGIAAGAGFLLGYLGSRK
ncbi:YqjD family protein [Loktanella agnita]|uniref:DUF883 family protein n=1 Tax=Loktanella agnita TaxID=287097 RepID=UPI003989CAD6